MKGKHIKDIAEFARENFAKRDLTAGPFPRDAWEEMRIKGLLEPCSSYEEMSMAGNAIVSNSGNIGIALSWMLHQLANRFVFERLGTPEQKKLIAGGKTASLAMSEPGSGAHPKHMKSFAQKVSGGFLITGEKAFITNAPVADMFVVIAITSEIDGKKRFSAFVMPRETAGLKVEDIEIPFLKPSPHGTLKIESCFVPDSSMIGNLGQAYEEIVLPFREIEDAAMMGPLSGAMEYIIRKAVLTRLLEKNPDDETKSDAGRMKAISDTSRIMAFYSGAMLDRNETADLLSLILVLRSLANEFGQIAKKYLEKEKIQDAGLKTLITDFSMMINIAGKVARIKQLRLGESLTGKSF